MNELPTVQCLKCASNDVEARNHEQTLQKIGGVLLSGAGTAAGTVGGAASGASIGAAIGGVTAGPLGVIMGATIGTFVGAISIGVTGGFLGHRVGKKAGQIVDKNIFLDYQCNACKHRFAVQHAVHINKE